jgi:lipid-binding SYLF domain-containing protein
MGSPAAGDPCRCNLRDVPSRHAGAQASRKEQKRQEVRKAARETLNWLYKIHPSAKGAVEGAAGYAAFSNFGMKIFVAGGGSGSGLAVNNKTKKETFMKMIEAQAGFGMGLKKFRVVFIFETQKALDDFVKSGWEFGGQTTAGGAVEGQGVSITGAIAVALTAKGTKYYKDSDLN